MISLPIDFPDTIPLPEKEKERLLASLQEPPPVSVRINPFKMHQELPFERVNWCQDGYYLPRRPVFTFDPVFHSGGYYVQEASSMIIGEIVKEICRENRIETALDLCASPGGKTTHLLSVLPPESLLISNEVVSSRLGALHENISKWGNANVAVSNNDPSHFSSLRNVFDLILVDAPCSGEGMFRKEEAALTEWSLKNVEMCGIRQRKILADVLPSLKPGGFLIYSTCTYNEKENEENVKYLLGDFDLVQPAMEDGRSSIFRFFPHTHKGEGLFVSVFRKKENDFSALRTKKSKDKKLNGTFQQFIKRESLPQLAFFENKGTISFFPDSHLDLLETLKTQLRFTRTGTILGVMKGNECIPDHDLFLSHHFDPKSLPALELSYEDALHFLSKENVSVTPDQKGWGYFTYRNLALGGFKAVPGRINNYFPKELKIRKKYDFSMKFSLLPL